MSEAKGPYRHGEKDGRYTVLDQSGNIAFPRIERIADLMNAAHAAGVEEGRRLERFEQSSSRTQDKHGDTLRRLAD